LELIRERDGAGTKALRNFKVDLDRMEEGIKKLTEKCLTDIVCVYPLTPRAKQIILLAGEYSERLHQNFIGHGHLMYGCLKSRDAVSNVLLLNALPDEDGFERELTSLLTTGKTSMHSVILDSCGVPYPLKE